MMDYKEYPEKDMSLKSLQAGFMQMDDYKKAHESLVIFCHDIFVHYEGGILLIRRKKEPAKDVLWPLGGRVMRGTDVFESAKIKVWEEAQLRLTDLCLLGMGRTYFPADPFGHGHGTDSVNAILFAKGNGQLRLDDLHEHPVIIKSEDCTAEFLNSLEPYVRDYLLLAFNKI